MRNCQIGALNENPEKIKIITSSQREDLEKWITCEYHKLYGYISDFEGHPLKSFILIKPDAFNTVCGVWSDSNGYYEIFLPRRTYNCFYVNNGKGLMEVEVAKGIVNSVKSSYHQGFIYQTLRILEEEN